MLPGMAFHPGKRRRDVLNVGRMRNFWREAIAGNDGQVARRGEPLADKDFLGPVTLRQRAAMERDDYRRFVAPFGT